MRHIDEASQTPEGRRAVASLLVRTAGLLSPRQDHAVVIWNEAETQFRLGVLTVALAVHRLDHGDFPARLDDLDPALLPEHLKPSTPPPGYVMRYHPGAPADGSSSRATFALTAFPEEPDETGVLGFCVDSTGASRSTTDGTAPDVVDGICDPTLPLTQ